MNICEHSLHADKKYQTKAKCVCCTSSCLPLAHQDTLRAFPRHPLEEVHCPTTRHTVPPSFHESMRCPHGVYAANICQRWKTRKRYPLSRWPWETRRERAGTIRSPTEAANGCHSWFKHWWRSKICIKIYKVSAAKEFPLFLTHLMSSRHQLAPAPAALPASIQLPCIFCPAPPHLGYTQRVSLSNLADGPSQPQETANALFARFASRFK